MVTGSEQLEVKDLVEILGSLAKSTKCCATGTCDAIANTEFDAPRIPTSRDPRDAVVLAERVGYLRG